MTSFHVFIATSLDGFIARSDGALDWLGQVNAANEDHGFDAFLAEVDGLIMGRETFQTVATFDPWPFEKHTIVLSSRLAPADLAEDLLERVSLARSVEDACSEANRRGWQRAYVDRGATIRSFLRAGLITEMVISRIPVLLGEGRPLFGPLHADIALRHVATRAFPSGLVQSRYETRGA